MTKRIVLTHEHNKPAAILRPRKSWLSILLKALGLISLCACVWIGWRMIDNQSQFQEWQARLAAIADSGAPIDALGVRMLHERRASKALTEEWLAIFDELTSLEFIESAESMPYLDHADVTNNRVPGPGQPWEIEDKARKLLTDTKAVRDSLRKLANKSHAVYFAMEYEGSDAGNTSIQLGYNQALNLIRFEAHMALRYNAAAAVLEDIRCFKGMSGLLDGDPSTMSLLLISSAQRLAMEIVQEAVEINTFNETQLRELLEVLGSFSASTARFRLALQGERGLHMSALAPKVSFGFLSGPFRGRLRMLELYERLGSINVEDGNAAMKVIDETQAEIEQYGFVDQSSIDGLALNSMIPLTASGTVEVRNRMKQRLASLAVAIQLYRMKFGKLPSTTAAVAEIGVDPTTLVPIGGKPFGYRFSEQGDSARLWGFYIPSRRAYTPDVPPDITDPLSQEHGWVWNIK